MLLKITLKGCDPCLLYDFQISHVNHAISTRSRRLIWRMLRQISQLLLPIGFMAAEIVTLFGHLESYDVIKNLGSLLDVKAIIAVWWMEIS